MLGSDRPIFKLHGAGSPPSPFKTPAPKASPAEEQARAVRQFVARVGGVENARRALEMLALLDRAA